ncbi:MAG: NAD(P)/FAD-dependent oxidoreductase [Gammaproteobacteria bacterium]
MDPIVIIGTGLAGYTAAREFRKLDQDTPLVLFSADDGGYYSKPMLSNALAQHKSAEGLRLSSAHQMAAQLRAEIHPHTRITALDAATRRLRFGPTELTYTQLVLALGADPIRLPLQGDAAASVLSVNDLTDYARFRAAIAGKRRIVILGGGLIGCEFANDLATAGYQVAVVDTASHPLGRLVPEPLGGFLREALARRGIDWHLGKSVTAVDHASDAQRITLSDGTALAADALLSAVGLRPRTSLAAAAGLKVNRGIATDRWLRSSDPHIYALGDCAEVEGLVLPFVMPLMHAARSLAQTLAGAPTPVSYPAMPVVVKTPACPLVVAPPAASAAGAWTWDSDSTGVRALFRNDAGELLGFALAGSAVAEQPALTKQLPATLP